MPLGFRVDQSLFTLVMKNERRPPETFVENMVYLWYKVLSYCIQKVGYRLFSRQNGTLRVTSDTWYSMQLVIFLCYTACEPECSAVAVSNGKDSAGLKVNAIWCDQRLFQISVDKTFLMVIKTVFYFFFTGLWRCECVGTLLWTDSQ